MRTRHSGSDSVRCEQTVLWLTSNNRSINIGALAVFGTSDTSGKVSAFNFDFWLPHFLALRAVPDPEP